MPLLEVRYDWVPVKDIVVPEDRYWSRMDPEDYESLREAVKRLGEDFSRLNPVKVAASRADGRLMLIDGANRLKAFKELGLERIFSIIAVYGSPEEAGEEARWGSMSENWIRAQRDPAQLIRLIRRWTEGMERNQAVQLIIKHTNYTKRYAYTLLEIARDEEVSRKVIEEGLSIYRAVELLKEKGKVYISEIISQEAEKPRIEEISAREAVSGEIKPLAAIGEEISARKPRFEEIFDEAVERVEARLQRPMNATLKAEMRNALQGLGLSSLDDIEYILLNAENNWGGEKSDVIKKAVRIWRRRVGELESPAMWGRVSFKEVLEEAREAAEEERARRAGREAYGGPRPRAERPAARAGPRPAASARESMVEVGPAPGVEEEPGLSAEYMEAKRRVLPERRDEARTVLLELLMREFPWAGDPSILANEFIGIYDEVGPIGTLLTLKLAMPKLVKILKPSGPPPRAMGWLSIVESALFYKKRSEVINAIYQTYEENRDEILEAVARHKEEEARALLEVLKSVEPRIVEHEGGDKTYLYFVPEKPRVALVLDKEVYVTLRDVEGEKGAKRRERRVRVQEALAERRFLGVRWWINKGAVAKTEEVRVLESPEGLGVFECPGCGEVAKDPYTGLPFICHKCLWPIPLDSLPYPLRYSRKRGA